VFVSAPLVSATPEGSTSAPSIREAHPIPSSRRARPREARFRTAPVSDGHAAGQIDRTENRQFAFFRGDTPRERVVGRRQRRLPRAFLVKAPAQPVSLLSACGIVIVPPFESITAPLSVRAASRMSLTNDDSEVPLPT
jgi:hypothetical protein